MNGAVGLFIMAFIATVLAILIVGTLSTGKLHLGIPDQ